VEVGGNSVHISHEDGGRGSQCAFEVWVEGDSVHLGYGTFNPHMRVGEGVIVCIF
jgi:hypothetical protein